MLPSKVINFETPVECLLQTTPNYVSLRIFGCTCWPNLCPYNKCKLDYRSTRCVFLGYSPCHKGVKCLDTKTGRVYISRDVVFDENIFPFATMHPNAGTRLRQEILLLPQDSSTPLHDGDAYTDDPMTVPMIPVATNQVAGNNDAAAPAENFAPNGLNIAENEQHIPPAEEDEPDT
jgi:hypothetical protein